MVRRILVPVDLDDPGSWEKTFPVAVKLCQCFGAALTVTHIVPDIELMLEAQMSPISFREIVESARVRLEMLADTIQGAGAVERRIEMGGIHAKILAVAEQVGADLILLSSHRPGIRDYLLGSNAGRVVRHAHCSVFVVRDAPEPSHG